MSQSEYSLSLMQIPEIHTTITEKTLSETLLKHTL